MIINSSATWNKVTGVGPKTALVITQAMSGQVPDYLQKLRDEKEPLVAGGLGMRAAVKGDLHCHSTWSDGGSPLEEMMITAQTLGHEYCAITDHSPRLTVARGLTAERLREQIAVVDDLNESMAPFRCLRGIEVDILEDGGLDQEDALLGELDVVVASVHSKLRSDSETMTHRMVGGDRQPADQHPRSLHGSVDRGGAGRPAASRSSTPRWSSRPAAPSTSPWRSTPAPSAATRRPGCSAGDRDGLPVLHRHRRPRSRSAGVPGLRLRAGRGSRARSRPGDQHLAGRSPAGLV